MEDGGILLKPMRVIPEADAWLYTPETRERLTQADAWMAANPPSDTDLDALARRARPDVWEEMSTGFARQACLGPRTDKE